MSLILTSGMAFNESWSRSCNSVDFQKAENDRALSSGTRDRSSASPTAPTSIASVIAIAPCFLTSETVDDEETAKALRVPRERPSVSRESFADAGSSWSSLKSGKADCRNSRYEVK